MFSILCRSLALLFVAVALIKPSPIIAQDTTYLSRDQSFGLTNYVKIDIYDEVDGKCWTNSRSVAARARLRFEQNDIGVFDYDVFSAMPFFYYVAIQATGFRTGGLCAGVAQLKTHWASHEVYGGFNNIEKFSLTASVVNYSTFSIMTSGTNLNEQISDFIDGAIADLITKIISARRDPDVQRMRRQFPGYLEKPPTEAEWKRLQKLLFGN